MNREKSKKILVFLMLMVIVSISSFAQRYVKFMAVGDSKTQGDSYLGWRDALYNKLQTAGYFFTPQGNYGNQTGNVGGVPPMNATCGTAWGNDIGANGSGYTGSWSIAYEGHGGFQAGKTCALTGYTDHSLAQMVDTDIPRFNPEIVTVDLGTNDILGGWTQHGPWPDGTTWTGRVEAAAANALGVVDQIHALVPNAYILVSEIGRASAGMSQALEDVGPLLLAGVNSRAAQGWKIQYVGNTYSDLLVADVDPDHVHPLRSGYLKMADRWFTALKPVFDQVLAGNAAPSVSISSPSNNATFTAPASITINATATDADGTVSKVDFYNGTTLLGTDNTSPYSYTWTSVAAGTYSITAKATDNLNLATTSTAVSVIVEVNDGTSKITGTGIGTAGSYQSGGNTFDKALDGNLGTFFDGPSANGNWVGIDQGASGTNVIKKVKFAPAPGFGSRMVNGIIQGSNAADFTGAVNLFTITTAPTENILTVATFTNTTLYRYVRYLSPNNGWGNVSEVEFWGSSGTSNQAPTCSITSPANNATFTAPASITINANAADADGTVSKVDFYNGATLLGTDNTSPYSYSWTSVAAGTYSLTAKATDNSNAVTTSAAVSVTVNAAGTNTKITGTGIGTAGSYQSLGNTFDKALDSNISTFFDGPTANGNWVGIDQGSAGTNVIKMVKYAPAAGFPGRMVNGIIQGSNAADFSGAVNLYTITTAPVEGSLTTANFTNTTLYRYLRYLSPTNGWGNISEIEFWGVSGTSNQAPTCSISSPANNATFTAPASITINANAADADGTVSKVDFYNGATLLGTDNTSPYSYSWTNVAAGTYSLTAKATDNSNAVTTSTAVSVTVNAAGTNTKITGTGIGTAGSYQSLGNTFDKALDGNLTTFFDGPTANGNWVGIDQGSAGTNVIKMVKYAPAAGFPSRMVNGVIQGSNAADFTGAVTLYTITTAPVEGSLTTANFTNTTLYRYLRYLSPTNGWGNISEIEFWGVSSGNQAPTCSITSPANNTSFAAPANITINATASDADGTVSIVDFYNGTTLLGTDNTSPYSYSWTGVAAGTYSITAKATDNSNAVTTSAAVNVTVTGTITSRDPLLWPFAKTSIWNMPIHNNATYVPAGIGTAANGVRVDEDIIVLTASAPSTPIYTNNTGWGAGDRCPNQGPLLFNAPIPGNFVYSSATWLGNTPNAGLAVLMSDGRTIKSTQPFARCVANSYATSLYSFADVDLYGDGIVGAHGASKLSTIGGAIRVGELTPNSVIRHALKMNAWGKLYFSQSNSGYRWPALSADGYYNSGANAYGGTVPECRMGSLLALPPSVDINNIGLVTAPAKILAKALQDYGAYIVDDAAWDINAFETENGPNGRVVDQFLSTWGFDMEASSGTWASDIAKIVTRLNVVNSNDANNIGGGPTTDLVNRRAPVAPDITAPTGSTQNIGETTILGSTDNNNASCFHSQKITLTQTSTINSMSIYCQTAGGNVILAIYDDLNNKPNVLKAQTSAFAPVAGQWNTQNVQTQVSLPAGTYWIAFQPGSNTFATTWSTTGGVSYSYCTHTYGTVENPFPTGVLQDNKWNIYGTFTTTGGRPAASGNSNNLISKIIIYPNPVFNGKIKILTPGIVSSKTVQIYDVLGRILLQKVLPEGFVYDIDIKKSNAKGNCLIKVITKQGEVMCRMIEIK